VNCAPAVLVILAVMSGDQGDALWEAFVVAMLATGPAVVRRSRYGNKPALFTASREFAHLEAPGIIDLRITRAGWSRVGDRFVVPRSGVIGRGGTGSSFTWIRQQTLTVSADCWQRRWRPTHKLPGPTAERKMGSYRRLQRALPAGAPGMIWWCTGHWAFREEQADGR